LCGITLLSTAALVVTGCSKSPRPHTLVFNITGRGELSSLTYVINGKETTERSVGLPWRKAIHLPAKDGRDTWRLKTQQSTGSSQVEVYVDDRPVSNGYCEGGGCNSEASGSVGD
jgi:hypothetical protein